MSKISRTFLPTTGYNSFADSPPTLPTFNRLSTSAAPGYYAIANVSTDIKNHEEPIDMPDLRYLYGLLDYAQMVFIIQLVLGIFSNVFVFIAFSRSTFRYMSYPVYAKIICILNICVLFLTYLRYQTFMMDDYNKRWTPSSQNDFCFTVYWFYLLFDHTLVWSLAFMLLDRIKSVNQVNIYERTEDALRKPLLLNVVAWLLIMVPVSQHTITLQNRILAQNMTHCVMTMAHTYPKLEVIEKIMGLSMSVEDAIVLCAVMWLLLALLVKAWKKRREKNKGFDPEMIEFMADHDRYTDTSSPAQAASFTRFRHLSAAPATVVQRNSVTPETFPVDAMWNESAHITDDPEVIDMDCRFISISIIYSLLYQLMRIPRDLAKSDDLLTNMLPDNKTTVAAIITSFEMFFSMCLLLPYPLHYMTSKHFREHSNSMTINDQIQELMEIGNDKTISAYKFSLDSAPRAHSKTDDGETVSVKHHILLADFSMDTGALTLGEQTDNPDRQLSRLEKISARLKQLCKLHSVSSKEGTTLTSIEQELRMLQLPTGESSRNILIPIVSSVVEKGSLFSSKHDPAESSIRLPTSVISETKGTIKSDVISTTGQRKLPKEVIL